MGQSTEWTTTKITDFTPRPNHRSASGISAMAGSGLNMAVRVSSTSAPSRVVTATVARTSASAAPMAMPESSTLSDCTA